MQIEDIIQEIDFHDSNIIELLHENNRVKLKTINENELWGVTRKKEILKLALNFKFIKAIKSFFKRRSELKLLESDYDKVRNYIKKYNPDYILSTHYQLLDAIPKEYLCKTIHEQHTSFYATKMVRDNIRIFDKYKNKIKFIWLTKSTCNEAIDNGYKNSNYIYNPVRFTKNKTASVNKNKKLITNKMKNNMILNIMVYILIFLLSVLASYANYLIYSILVSLTLVIAAFLLVRKIKHIYGYYQLLSIPYFIFCSFDFFTHIINFLFDISTL